MKCGAFFFILQQSNFSRSFRKMKLMCTSIRKNIIFLIFFYVSVLIHFQASPLSLSFEIRYLIVDNLATKPSSFNILVLKNFQCDCLGCFFFTILWSSERRFHVRVSLCDQVLIFRICILEWGPRNHFHCTQNFYIPGTFTNCSVFWIKFIGRIYGIHSRMTTAWMEQSPGLYRGNEGKELHHRYGWMVQCRSQWSDCSRWCNMALRMVKGGSVQQTI